MVWRDAEGYRYLDDSQSGYTWWCQKCDPKPRPYGEVAWLDRTYSSAYARGFDEHWAYARGRGLSEHEYLGYLVYYRDREPIPIWLYNLREEIEAAIKIVLAYERKLGIDDPKTCEVREKWALKFEGWGLWDEGQLFRKRQYAGRYRLP